MPRIDITWDAVLDAKTCKICRALHSYTWRFVVGSNPIGDSLVHPTFGEVWNTTQGSQAHGHTNINCRCTIHPTIDVSDLKGKIATLKEQVEVQMRE